MCADWNNELQQWTVLLSALAVQQNHRWHFKTEQMPGDSGSVGVGEAWAILIFKHPAGHSYAWPERSANKNTWKTWSASPEWTNEWKGSLGL